MGVSLQSHSHYCHTSTVTVTLCDMIIFTLFLTAVAGLDIDVSTMRNLTITPRETRQVPALACGSRANLQNSEEVTLESPNYPDPYPNRAKCKWVLVVPAGEEVQVYCESFHIEPATGGSTESTEATTAGVTTTAPAGSCQCGIKGGSQTDRIVGGQETEEHEYPWQVGLVSRNGKTPWCGGTLISDRHILTAAHCTAGMTTANLQILLGEHRTNDDVFTRVDVSQINNDPTYSFPNSDFSILTLTEPVSFTSSVRPAF